MGRTIRNKNKRDKKRLKEYRKSRQKRSFYYDDNRKNKNST